MEYLECDKLNFERRSYGDVVVDTWSAVGGRKEDAKSIPQMAIITGFGVRPPCLRLTEQAVSSFNSSRSRRLGHTLENIRKINYMGSFPLELAVMSGGETPVHVLWQPAETRGDLFPKYEREDPERIAKGLSEISHNGKGPLFTIGHSYGVAAQLYSFTQRDLSSNIYGGVSIAPLTRLIDAFNCFGGLKDLVLQGYKLASHFDIPGVNLVARDYLHRGDNELEGLFNQKQRTLVSMASAKAMLGVNLSEQFSSSNLHRVPSFIITQQDKLIPSERQTELAEALGAQKYYLPAGHRVFTNILASTSAINLIIGEANRQLGK